MKLEREKDIPAFKGRTWRERINLRSLAKERDHSIIWLQMLCGALAAPILALSYWLMTRFSPQQSWLIFVVIYVALSYPTFTLFYSLFITPKIRRALESEPKPSA